MIADELRPGDHLVLEVLSNIADPLDKHSRLVAVRLPGEAHRTMSVLLDAAAEVSGG